MKHRILVARPMPAPVTERAQREFDAILSAETLRTERALEIANAERVEALVFGGHLKLPAHAIAGLPDSVRVLASTSVGFEHIDVDAARARGIMATFAPNAVTACTADLAMMLMLCACRRAHEYEALMRGGWTRLLGFGEMLGVRFSGKTLGIYGMGRIGRAVARRARGFDMRIIYHDVARLPEDVEEGAEFCADFEGFLSRCDILSLHAPHTSETERIVNARTLDLLPRGAVLVNAARGPLVDEEALIAALRSGQLFAAGLDVFPAEPHVNEALNALPNAFLTPHIGGATIETRTALAMTALDNVREVLDGREALDPLWR